MTRRSSAKTIVHAAAILAAVTGSPAPDAAAGLTAGEVVIVTDAGLFHHDGNVGSSAVMLAPASAFGGLTAPAVEWDRGTDAVFVCTGAKLLRVTVTGNPPSGVAIQDVTPTVPGAAATPLYYDLDVDPVTDRLYALDRANGQILGFDPPFSAGMAPVSSAAVVKATRGIAVDSRTFPRTLVTADSSEIRRVDAVTGATETVSFGTGTAVDCEPQVRTNAMVCRKNDSKIFGTTNNPNLVFDINLAASCQPVALGPQDGEWDPVTRRLYVLAEDGINGCYGSYFQGNHLVRFQVPAGGPNPPLVLTPTTGSGISGAAGDLCVIHDDFAFAGVYGAPCAAAGGAPVLDALDGLFYVPEVGNPAFAIELADAPAGAPAALLIGVTATAAPTLPCPVLVVPAVAVALGPVGPAGEILLPAPIPAAPALVGLDARLQAAVGLPNGAAQLTPGLRVHLGL